MINSIKELVNFIEHESRTSHKAKKAKKISGKKRELYELIKSNDSPTVEAMQNALYPNGKRASYLKLQERLCSDLVDIVFFSIENGKGGYMEVRAGCIKRTALLRVLKLNGLLTNIIELSNPLIKTCLKYEFNDLLNEILLINMELYGMLYQDKRKYFYFRRLYDKVNRILLVENDMQLRYSQYFIDFATSKELMKDGVRLRLEEELDFLKNLLTQNVSYRTNIYCHNSLCIIYEILGHFGLVVARADLALSSIKSSVQDNSLLRMSFLQKKLRALVRLNNQKLFMETLSEIERMEDELEHITFQSVYFFKALMYIHWKKYSKAIEIVSTISLNRRGMRMSAVLIEGFRILKGYLYWLNEEGIVTYVNSTFKRFKVYKFLNEVPIFSKDKSAANIGILILHVLFLLSRRKYDIVIERADSLQQYTYRYLRKDDTFRSNCFIKMIVQMTKANFHPVRTRRYCSKLREKLSTMPLKLSEQPLEVEIIPYEDLWEMILAVLDRQHKESR